MTDWNNFADAQRDISTWAGKQFPKRTVAGVYLKLYGEVYESIRNPGSPDEFADLMILLLDLASMQHINVANAIADKMKINKKRLWIFDEITGLAQHVEGT